MTPELAAERRQLARLAIAVALVALVLTAADVASRYAPNTWINRDARFYTNVNVSLVEDGSLVQDRFARSWYEDDLGWNRRLDAGWSNVALGRDDHRYPKHPVLMPLLSTPLFWAFGLAGTLIFNVLMFGAIAAAAFLFARAYVAPPAAAAAALGLVLATAVREYAYDYHVDVLLLALFTTALAAMAARRGMLAGALVALTVTLKPTSLIWVPSVALLALERRDLRAVVRATIGGAIVLGLFALSNWWFYGRPWWSGYNRVLVRENGELVIADVGDAFSIPFEEGFPRIWSGAYGIRSRLTLFALAIPGALILVRRRPIYVLATILAIALSVFVFSKYHFEGDRFHWPAFAFALPALGAALEAIARLALRAGRAIVRLARRRSDRAPLPPRPAEPAEKLAAATAGALVVAVCALPLAFDHPLVTHVGSGTAAAAIAAPFSVLAGAYGVLALHLAAAFAIAYAAARVISRAVPPVVAGAIAAGVFLLPGVAPSVLLGGPDLLAAAAGLLALACALAGAWRVAGVLAVLCSWIAGAPWLVPISVLILALPASRRALLRAAIAIGLTGLAWVIVDRAVPEGALASISEGYPGITIAGVIDGVGLRETLAAIAEPARRWIVALTIATPLALLLVALRDARVAAALAIALLSLAVRDVATAVHGRLPLLALALALIALGSALWLFAGAIAVFGRRIATPRRAAVATAVALVLLFAIGGVRRAIAAGEPPRLASPATVQHAEVQLGDIPCDFLAWEHMSWECSHFDRGLHGMVGLALSDPPRVGGEPAPMLVLPTGFSGQRRRVVFRDLPAHRYLELAWAVPDGAFGDCALTVLVNGAEITRIDVPRMPTGEIERRTLDLGTASGAEVDVELLLQPARLRSCTLAVDGVLRDEPSDR